METSVQIMTGGSPKTANFKKTQIYNENSVFQKPSNYLSKTMVFHIRDNAFSYLFSKLTDFVSCHLFVLIYSVFLKTVNTSGVFSHSGGLGPPKSCPRAPKRGNYQKRKFPKHGLGAHRATELPTHPQRSPN